MGVYVDVLESIAKERDSQGLYRETRSGQSPIFTSIDSEYEVPEKPKIFLDADHLSVNVSADGIIAFLSNNP